MNKIRIGTRGSRLALRQSEMVEAAIKSKFPEIETEICVISTRGDRDLEMSLTGQLEKGLFTREIEAALLDESIDIAVHSLKDLPVEPPQGICIGAYLPRASVEDVWIGRLPLDELPAGAVIGTSSPRRIAQLRLIYPDFEYKAIRGNVETRIAKVDSGEYDGIIMAKAGMERLGLEGRITEVISPLVLVPAPGQAAIAVHRRKQDKETAKVLAKINHGKTKREVETERLLLSSIGGGCALPFACHCTSDEEEYHLQVYYASDDMQKWVRLMKHFPDFQYEEAIIKISKELQEGLK